MAVSSKRQFLPHLAQLGTQLDLSSCKSSLASWATKWHYYVGGTHPPTHPPSHPVYNLKSWLNQYYYKLVQTYHLDSVRGICLGCLDTWQCLEGLFGYLESGGCVDFSGQIRYIKIWARRCLHLLKKILEIIKNHNWRLGQVREGVARTVKSGYVKSGEVKSVRTGSGQVKPGKVNLDRSGQVKSGQVNWGEVKLGQVRSGQVKPGKVKSGQVKSG